MAFWILNTHTWDAQSEQHHTNTPFNTTCNGSLHQWELDHSSIFIPPSFFLFLFLVNYTTTDRSSNHHLLYPSKIKKQTFNSNSTHKLFNSNNLQNKHNPNCTKNKPGRMFMYGYCCFSSPFPL